MLSDQPFYGHVKTPQVILSIFIRTGAEKKRLSHSESYLHFSNPLLVASLAQVLSLSNLNRREELHEGRPHSIAVSEPFADFSALDTHLLELSALAVRLLVSHCCF